METNDTREDGGWDSPARFVPAIVLIGIGALFLMSNLHVFPGVRWFDFWPAILIAIGIIKLVDAGPEGHYAGAVILLAIGIIFLANNFHYLPFPVWDLWPLMLIAVGLALLVDRVTWRDRIWGRSGHPIAFVSDASGDLNLTAAFSGGKRTVTSEDFRGGAISALFGGFEVDLRRAGMKADSAVLRVDVVFGGAEIKVPETWCAVVQGSGIFGGYSDETSHPPLTPGVKRLIVKGGAVFGGVVVKN